MDNKFESIIRCRELFEDTNLEPKFYHASEQPIKSIIDIDFTKSKEIGLHVGTYQQAINRGNLRYSGNFYLCCLNFNQQSKNIEIYDMNYFNTYELREFLVNFDEYSDIKDEYNKYVTSNFQKYINRYNKDGFGALDAINADCYNDFYKYYFSLKDIKYIKYINEYESKPNENKMSYILLTKDIITDFNYLGYSKDNNF